MSTENKNTPNNSIKPIQLQEHGCFLYGTLDGLDFTASGVFPETKRPYGASIKLRFIMKTSILKDFNGTKIPIKTAKSVIVKLDTTDDKLVSLVQKYNDLAGKNLFINYIPKDGDILNLQDENEIIEVK